MKLSKLLREPLTHFLILGALLAAAGHLLGGDDAPTIIPSPSQDPIRVTQGQIESLASSFEATYGRAPTAEETDKLIDLWVREEALVREALAAGMAHEDAAVRARLAQRMRFFGAAGADESIPTDEELDRFRRDHPEMFSSPGTATFEHVYLDGKVWGPRIDDRAAELLATLRGMDEADPEKFSDPFRRPYAYENYALDVTERTYGSSFGALVARSPIGKWSGPVDSVYGVHLVRVIDRQPGELLPLETVRDGVATAWRDQRRVEAIRAFEDDLLGKYEVIIDAPAESPEDAGGEDAP